jgi:hypothetical protein
MYIASEGSKVTGTGGVELKVNTPKPLLRKVMP